MRTSVAFMALLLCVLILAPSFVIRLWPITSESFGYDAITSQLAASKGFIANAMDRSNMLTERRGHPPLLSYIILLNNHIFGSDAFRARIFSMVAGSLCCLAVSLSLMKILTGLRGRALAALFGGWMLCLLPVHLYVSRTANWDSVYSLLATCSLMFLSLHLAKPSMKSLLCAGALAGLAFLTSEGGILLVPVFGFILYMDLRRSPLRLVAKNWALAALSLCVLFIFLWPASMVKLDIARTILFRVRDNSNSTRNLPWFAFYTELFRQSPAFSIAAVLGLAALALNLRAARNASDELRFKLMNVYTMIAPFALYTAVVFAVSMKQRLVYVHHIADMMPPLAVVLSCAPVAVAALARPRAKTVIVMACILLVVLSIPPVIRGDPETVGPQEFPGYLGVRDFLKEHPNARTYYYYAFHMSYYLPEAKIEGDSPRFWTAEKTALVKHTSYDFIVVDRSMFSNTYPDIRVLADALHPEYELVHTICHRRTREPVAWIFGRPTRLSAG